VFSGVFVAEGVGVGDERLGDARMVDVPTLLEVFLNMSLRSDCSIGEASVWSKAKLMVFGLFF